MASTEPFVGAVTADELAHEYSKAVEEIPGKAVKLQKAKTLKEEETLRENKLKAAYVAKPGPSHPRYDQMICEAIATLKDRGGSSLQAIWKFISEKYKCDIKSLDVELHQLTNSGKLAHVKGSYKLAEEQKKAKAHFANDPAQDPSKEFKPKAPARKNAAAATEEPVPPKKASGVAKEAALPGVTKEPIAKKPVSRKNAAGLAAKQTFAPKKAGKVGKEKTPGGDAQKPVPRKKACEAPAKALCKGIVPVVPKAVGEPQAPVARKKVPKKVVGAGDAKVEKAPACQVNLYFF